MFLYADIYFMSLMAITVPLLFLYKSQRLFDINMIIVLIFCLFVAEPEIQKPFNYYKFALQECNSSVPYTIHGLWPQYDSESWPQFCTKEVFNKTIIKMLPEMSSDWHSCYGSNFDFWSHEWSKHGTCSGLQQIDYFNHILLLYSEAVSEGYVKKCYNKECYFNVSKDFHFI